MKDIVSAFTSIGDAHPRKDDDFVDRLNCKYTVVICVVFAIVVSMHQYVGNPITCWPPQHFTGSHTKYTNAYCWVRNTYYLSYDEEIPKEDEHERRQMIPYYQWIPFILLGQAVMFYMPCILWHSFNYQSGVDADNILGSAQSFTKADKAGSRDSTLILVRNSIDRFLSTRKSLRKAQWKHTLLQKGALGRRFGCYLVILYLISKVLYLTNVIAQLFILNSILSIKFSIYGIEVVKWMMDDYDWTNSPQVAFPRVTMCDFKVRRLGNIHRYTVQCTLPINLYTEKIYMFLWFWMVFVAVCTAISLITWIGRVLSPSDRITYISNHLKMSKKIDKAGRVIDYEYGHERSSGESEKDQCHRFVRSYLRQDGVFLLRLIGHNTNTITVTEIVASLWDLWKRRDENKQRKPELEPMKPKSID